MGDHNGGPHQNQLTPSNIKKFDYLTQKLPEFIEDEDLFEQLYEYEEKNVPKNGDINGKMTAIWAKLSPFLSVFKV